MHRLGLQEQPRQQLLVSGLMRGDPVTAPCPGLAPCTGCYLVFCKRIIIPEYGKFNHLPLLYCSVMQTSREKPPATVDIEVSRLGD